MSVLKCYFDKSVNQCSPTRDDFDRVVNYDSDGNEYITWRKVDYESVVKQKGTVSDWNLNALLKAGINPNFPIHTGYNTRLEGMNDVHQFETAADSILDVEPIEDNKE